MIKDGLEEHTLALSQDMTSWCNTDVYKQRMEHLKCIEVEMKEVGELAKSIVEENNHVPEITADFEAFQASEPFFADFIEQVKKYYRIEAQTGLLATKTVALRPGLTITVGDQVRTSWRKMFMRVKEMEVQRPSVHSLSAQKRLNMMIEVLEDLLLRLQLDGRPVETTSLLISRFRSLGESLLSNLSDFYDKLAERQGKLPPEYIQNCERDVNAFMSFALDSLQANFKAFSLKHSDMERYKKLIKSHGDMLLNAVRNATVFYERMSILSEKMKLIEIELDRVFAITEEKFIVVTPTAANAARGVVERNERLKAQGKITPIKPDRLKQLEEQVEAFIRNLNPILDQRLSEYKDVLNQNEGKEEKESEETLSMTGRSFSSALLLKSPKMELSANKLEVQKEFTDIAEKAIQMNSLIEFQKLEIEMKGTEITEKTNEIYRLKAEILRLRKELEGATAQNASDARTISSMKHQIIEKDKKITELGSKDDEVILRKGMIDVGTHLSRKYRMTFIEEDQVSNSELITKVLKLARDCPSMDQETSDLTATIVTELKRIIAEDVETTNLDELLQIIDENMSKLKSENRDLKNKIRKVSTDLSETVILGRKDPSSDMSRNIELVKDLVVNLTKSNEKSLATLTEVKRQNRMNWYRYCTSIGVKTVTDDMSEEELISLASSGVEELQDKLRAGKNEIAQKSDSVSIAMEKEKEHKEILCDVLEISHETTDSLDTVIHLAASELEKMRRKLIDLTKTISDAKLKIETICGAVGATNHKQKNLLELLDLCQSDLNYFFGKLKQLEMERSNTKNLIRESYELLCANLQQPIDMKMDISMEQLMTLIRKSMNQTIRAQELNSLFHQPPKAIPREYLPLIVTQRELYVLTNDALDRLLIVLNDIFTPVPIGQDNTSVLAKCLRQMQAEYQKMSKKLVGTQFAKFLSKILALLEALIIP